MSLRSRRFHGFAFPLHVEPGGLGPAAGLALGALGHADAPRSVSIPSRATDASPETAAADRDALVRRCRPVPLHSFLLSWRASPRPLKLTGPLQLRSCLNNCCLLRSIY